jgi:hypothetical protein
MALQNYSKTTWENTPSTATPLNAANLNNMENGISRATTAVQDLESKTVLSVGSSNELVKADSSGKFNRSGAFVSNDQTKIIDNSSVEKYVPTARAIAKKLSGYALTGNVPTKVSDLQNDSDFVNNDDVFEALDGAFSGNSSNEPALLLDDTVDQTSNPDGNIILYYIDSEGTRHNLFNFSEVFYTWEEVDSNIEGRLEDYAPRAETAPTSTVGFDADGYPAVILSATTFSAGACTNTSIKKLYVPSTVTRIDSGAFYSCTALTDVYIDNTTTGITVSNSAFPSGVIVHYHTYTGRMTFNVVDELIKAVNTFEEDLANAAY